MESVVAIRYAAALFEVGEEENCLDSLWEELLQLRAVMEENPDYLKLLQAPMLPKEEKLRLLSGVFEGKLSTYARNFLEILTVKGRMDHFYQVMEEFKTLYHQKNNIQEAVAVTAVPLNEELAGKLTAKLEEMTGKKILLENRVDPSILGGVVIKMDNDQIDASVRSRLEGLRRQISAIIA